MLNSLSGMGNDRFWPKAAVRRALMYGAERTMKKIDLRINDYDSRKYWRDRWWRAGYLVRNFFASYDVEG